MQAWIWTCVPLLLAPLALAEDSNSVRLSRSDLTVPLPLATKGGLQHPNPQAPEHNIHLPPTLPPDEPSLPNSPTPSTESATKGPASRPRPDLVGIRGYRRFHANDSLIGRPIGCTHEEKLCFKYNRLYNRDYNGCYGLGDWELEGEINVGELYEISNGSSHLTGITYTDICPGYRMAFDDICYKRDVVRRYICGCDAEPTWHILGGVECRCTPPTPIRVEQPAEEGKCRVPDLRFPEKDTFHYFQNTSSEIQGFILHGLRANNLTSVFACSLEQMECFSRNKVWLPAGKGCFPLLERGPCAEEHLVALDVHAANEGRAEGTCVHVHGGCPQGHVRMDFDGECHNADDVKISVAGELVRDPFGMFAVIRRSEPDFKFALWRRESVFNVHESDVLEPCAVTVVVDRYYPVANRPFKPLCGANDKNECARYEVVAEIPTPELEL